MKIVVTSKLKDGVRLFDLSTHDEPGGTGNVREIGGEKEIRAQLLGMGLTQSELEDAMWLLRETEFLALDLRLVRARRSPTDCKLLSREDLPL